MCSKFSSTVLQTVTLPKNSSAVFAIVFFLMAVNTESRKAFGNDLALWIDKRQIREFHSEFFSFFLLTCSFLFCHYNRLNDILRWIRLKKTLTIKTICCLLFSGPLQIDVFVISNGELESLIKEPTFERHLPAIPDSVTSVNFTWRGGDHKSYVYEFLNLESSNLGVLNPPKLSIPMRGKVPKKTKGKTQQRKNNRTSKNASDVIMNKVNK